MRPTVCSLLIVGAVLAVALPPGAPAQDDPTRACLRAGRTISATPQIRVFRLDGLTRACWTPRRRVRRLPMGDGAGGTVTVEGRHVAWRSVECGAQDERCDTTVHVLDVRTGQERFRTILPDAAIVSMLVLARGGWPAWVEPARPDERVVTLTKAGERRVLDTGQVASRSLAVGGDRVYWVRDGEPRVARLPLR